MRKILPLLFILSACAGPQKPPVTTQKPAGHITLVPAKFENLPGWQNDDLSKALPALQASCEKHGRTPPDRLMGFEGVAEDAASWQAPCVALKKVPGTNKDAARAFFETWFLPFQAKGEGDPEGLFTGYYEPELNGARTRHGKYQTPLYRKPADLVTADLGLFRDEWKGIKLTGRVTKGVFRPFEDRAGITAGALTGKNLELAWVDDPIDAFFLQIQGSGRVRLEDGTILRVGYDGQNGHEYYAIGKELIARGALTPDTVSLQTIRAWLQTNPREAQALMNKNPSFVFFRELKESGPVGADGVTLTPGRSLAIDRSFVPLGIPAWLDAEDPLVPGKRIDRLMVTQDTGGAIRGPVRGDVFWGAGKEAEARAGIMKSKGGYWLFLPKAAPAEGKK